MKKRISLALTLILTLTLLCTGAFAETIDPSTVKPQPSLSAAISRAIRWY